MKKLFGWQKVLKMAYTYSNFDFLCEINSFIEQSNNILGRLQQRWPIFS